MRSVNSLKRSPFFRLPRRRMSSLNHLAFVFCVPLSLFLFFFCVILQSLAWRWRFYTKKMTWSRDNIPLNILASQPPTNFSKDDFSAIFNPSHCFGSLIFFLKLLLHSLFLCNYRFFHYFSEHLRLFRICQK